MNKYLIEDVLLKIKSDVINLKPFDNLNYLIDKYEILFYGDNFRCLNSVDLFHYLNKENIISSTIVEFNNILPKICDELGMSVETFIFAGDLQNKKIEGYKITLF